MSGCHELIGIRLLHIDVHDIIWPKKYTIPFACIGVYSPSRSLAFPPSVDADAVYWEDVITNKILNVKLICPMRFRAVYDRDEDIPFVSRYEWVYDEILDMERVNVAAALSASNSNEKCLLLDRDSCDDDTLFHEILNDTGRRKKIDNTLEEYQQLWSLNAAKWISDITNISN